MAHPKTDMSPDDIENFLQAPRFAIFSTNRVNGPPQLTPVWYLYEDRRLYVSMSVKSAKYRNLSRDPRVGICIPGAHPDARAIMIYGTAEPAPENTAGCDDINWRIMRRYYDSDAEVQAYVDSLPTGDESALVVINPNRILAQDYN